MSEVRVAIVGVGNCASSLVQGVEYYKDADPKASVPGLMHVQFGDYHVKDVKFVAAFDVDATLQIWHSKSLCLHAVYLQYLCKQTYKFR